MAVVGVNKDGTEVIGEELVRCTVDKYGNLLFDDGYYKINNNETFFWICPFQDSDNGWIDISVEIPKGTIKKLIGHELTWEDECVEL